MQYNSSFEEYFEYSNSNDFQDYAHISNVRETREILKMIKFKQNLQDEVWVRETKNNVPYFKRIPIRPDRVIKFEVIDLSKYL